MRVTSDWPKSAALLGLFAAAWLAYLAASPSGNLHATAEAAEGTGGVPKLVLAFYYPWYGNPSYKDGSGRWSHWSGVEERAKRIGSSTHYPVLGPYDSHSPSVIDRHCQWAKQAGVDAFIASWWGHGSFSARALPKLLDVCAKRGLAATIYYEKVPGSRTVAATAKDIVALLERHAVHPGWLRVGGKPVLFIYGRAIGQLGVDRWAEVIEQVNSRFRGGALFIGDRPRPEAARVFDGIHTYNLAGALRDKDLDTVADLVRKRYRNWVQLAAKRHRICALTVIPGYDDTKIRHPGLKVPRRDGQLYRLLWQEAIAAKPHWVLITSWNEWHEGSEIEPSLQYGEQYLKLTAEFSAKFKAD